MKKFLLLFVSSLLVFSCDHDDGPKSIFQFSIKGLDTSLSDDWIIVRDNETGDLIDFKSVENGVPLNITGKNPTSGKLSITWFRKVMTANSAFKNYIVDSYAEVPVGSNWYVNPDTTNISQPGTVTGKYTLNIFDIPAPISLGASDDQGQNDIGEGWSGNIADIDDIKIRTGSPKHMITVTTVDDDPKYLMLIDLAAGVRNTEYSAFTDFDKVVTVNFPLNDNVTFEEYGFEPGRKIGDRNSYLFGDNYLQGLSSDHIKFRFLDDFPNYSILLDVGKTFKYRLQGLPPTSVEFPDPSKFLLGGDKDMENFSLSSNVDYAYRVTSYGYKNALITVQLNFYAASNVKQVQPIPNEILSQYSDLQVGQVEFEQVGIFTKERAYQDFLAEKFKQRTDYTKSDTYETMEVILK